MDLSRDFETDEHPFLNLQKVDSEIDSFDFRKQDIYAMMISLTPALVEKARTAALSPDYSLSYRGFWVGASMVAYDTDVDNPRIGVFTAGNFKAALREEDKSDADVADIPKNCAEVNATIEADHNNFQRIGFVVVAATANGSRIEDVTKIASATLWPCQDCSNMMAQEDSLFDRDTIVLSVGSGSDIFQVQSTYQLRKRYEQLSKGEVPADLPVHKYSAFDWADREYAYRQERKRRRLRPTVYDRNMRREKECRKLALLAMTDDL